MNFVDTLLFKKENVGRLQILPDKWEALWMHFGGSSLGFVIQIEPVQEAIMDVRPSFVAAGIYLRPRIFPPTIQELQDVPADAASASDGSPNKDLPYTQTQTLYLKTTGAAKGVLQVHRDPRTHVAGHILF